MPPNTRSSRTTPAIPLTGEFTNSSPLLARPNPRKRNASTMSTVSTDRGRRRQPRPPKEASSAEGEQALFVCPFSIVRQNIPTCHALEAGRKTRKAISRHLRKIRFQDNDDKGFDYSHPQNDPLWDSSEVKALLKRRCRRSNSEERRARKDRNHRYYKRRRTEMKEIQQELCDGRISQTEAYEKLSKISVGWYRHKYDVQRLESEKKSLAQQVSAIQQQRDDARSSGNEVEAARLQAQLDQRNRDLDETDRKLAEALRTTHLASQEFNRMNTDLNALFWDSNREDGGLPQMPIGSSRDDFLLYLSLILPMSMWQPDQPLLRKNINTTRNLLSSDKQYSSNNHLGHYLLPQQKEEILKHFNDSLTNVEEFLADACELERNEFIQKSVKTHQQVQEAFHPIAAMHSPFIFMRIVSNAHETSLSGSDSESEELERD